MKNLDSLTSSEKETLLKFPAYISLLAANWNGELNDYEREEAISFSHIKTFSSDPMLSNFYKEADKVLKNNLAQLDKDLPKEKEGRDDAIKSELAKLDGILKRLGRDYASTMHTSMKSFKEHVSEAHHSILESFIFPIPIKGLAE